MIAARSGIIAVLTAFFAMPSLAQPYDLADKLAASPRSGKQPIASVVYKRNLLAGKVLVGQPPGNMAAPLWDAKNLRISNLSVGGKRTGMFVINDHASFTVYAPTQAVNGALCFARAVSRSSPDNSLTMWIQGLSLVARRQVNTELAYSVTTAGRGRFDSAITYRLNPNTASGNPDVVASLRYSFKL